MKQLIARVEEPEVFRVTDPTGGVMLSFRYHTMEDEQGNTSAPVHTPRLWLTDQQARELLIRIGAALGLDPLGPPRPPPARRH